MSAFKLENLEHIWDDKKESEKVSAFLYGAYTRLEKDFLAVLEYIPLREQHLSVSSPRFADFVLRTSPLINKTFRILTFGRGTLEKLERETNPANSNSMSSEDLFSIQELLLYIYKYKKKDRDSISHYYKWFSNDLFYKLYPVNEDEFIKTIRKTEIIDSELKIIPFKDEIWKNWVNNRRKIEHRNQTEASIECVLQGLAITAKLLETYANCRYPGDWFESSLFNISSNLVFIYNSQNRPRIPV